MCVEYECFGPRFNTNYKSGSWFAEERKSPGQRPSCLYGQLLQQPRFIFELHNKECFACGTFRKNRKNLPKAVTTAKLKRKGDCIFRRDDPLLYLKWQEKKDVVMLRPIHEAIFVETGKVDREGNKIEKIEAVYYYCSRVGGADLSDQLLNYFTFVHKSTKWSQKLLIHLFNLVILNAYILNRHYGLKNDPG